MPKCSVSNCDNQSYIRGLCHRHYKLDLIDRAPPCSVDGCGNRIYTKKLCEIHYKRMRTHGSTDRPERKPNPNARGNPNTGPAHHRFRHGMTGTPTYKAWTGMKRRCYCETDSQFKDWGGRGIKVCDRWLNSFENFLADMGLCPPGMTIDREDNDGNYEPGNCRWADRTTQSRNRRYARITAEIAQLIRLDRSAGKTLAWISERFQVSQSHASRIVKGASWA